MDTLTGSFEAAITARDIMIDGPLDAVEVLEFQNKAAELGL